MKRKVLCVPNNRYTWRLFTIHLNRAGGFEEESQFFWDEFHRWKSGEREYLHPVTQAVIPQRFW